MSNAIIYYEAEDGESDVVEFLAALKRRSRKAHVKCLAYIDLLRDPGPPLTANYAKKLRGRIWELRPEFGGTEYRFLYAQLSGQQFIILTAFKKDQWEVPETEIRRAGRRLADHERRMSR